MAASKHTTLAIQLDLALPQTQMLLSLDYPAREEWRPVVGWEGLYEVSNMGHVRSVTRRFLDARGRKRVFQGQPLRLIVQGKGYHATRRKVSLIHQERRILRAVHHLVLEAFVGPRPEGYSTNHRDGDPTNNRVENLEWVTYAENNRHALATGLSKQRGATHSRAILTEDDVRCMRRLYAEGVGSTAIARRFSLHLSTVNNVVRRQWWKHVPEEV